MPVLKMVLIAAPLALTLAACGSRDDGGSADEFAARMDAANPAEKNEQLKDLPKAAVNGREAIRYTKPYWGVGADGQKSGVQFFSNGMFRLQEEGRTVDGRYEWLLDGKRIKLQGVQRRPIILIADNGAVYRMTNENVPITDLTPDRLYSAQQ